MEEDQINRVILDNFSSTGSVENIPHEVYKMNSTEILKGLENGSIHFITVPRDEFIDHTLIPEYLTHGFVIDTLLNSTDNTTLQNDTPSQEQTPTSPFISNTNIQHQQQQQQSNHQITANLNDIQLQQTTHLNNETEKRLTSTNFLQGIRSNFLRSGNGVNNSLEQQIIGSNKELINSTDTHVIDASIKSDNSVNSIDASTFFAFDDQQSLTTSFLNDGQIKVFSSPDQSQTQSFFINSNINTVLPQLTPIRRINRGLKDSSVTTIPDSTDCKNLRASNVDQGLQLKSTAKKVLPHKKRITKKLKSIDSNQKTGTVIDNATKAVTSQFELFQDLNEAINEDEVINLNSAPQFSCQICGMGVDSQLDFFAHLKMHYEPKTENSPISHITIIRDDTGSKEFNVQSDSQQQNTQQNSQNVIMNQQNSSPTSRYSTNQFSHLTLTNSQSNLEQKANQHLLCLNGTAQYNSFEDLINNSRQIDQNNLLQNNSKCIPTTNLTKPESNYLNQQIKKINETRDLNVVPGFSQLVDNFSTLTSATSNSNSANPTSVESPSEYVILNSTLTNHIRIDNSHCNTIEISKQPDFYTQLPTTHNHHNHNYHHHQQQQQQSVTLSPRSLLSHHQTPEQQSNQLNSNHEIEKLKSSPISNTTDSQVIQHFFQDSDYFEQKFTPLNDKVINLESKIDSLRVDNNSLDAISNQINDLQEQHHHSTRHLTNNLPQSCLINAQNQHTPNPHIEIVTPPPSQSQHQQSSIVNDDDETDNITPSIGQLDDQRILTLNNQKTNSSDICILQNNEVEFSDTEDMLEGIRGVVDKVQEAFDTGDEMEPINSPRFNDNSQSVILNTKDNSTICSSNMENDNSVVNFHLFFKSRDNSQDASTNEEFTPAFDEISSNGTPQPPVISDQNDMLVEANTLNANNLISIRTLSLSPVTDAIVSDDPESTDNNKPATIGKIINLEKDIDDSSWNAGIDIEPISDKEDSQVQFTDLDNDESNYESDETASSDSKNDEKNTKKKNNTLNYGVLSEKTEKKKYVCKICSKIFNSTNALKYHDFSHSGQRPFPCTECGKSFFAQNALRNHQRVHSGEKPFSCEDCGRAFRQWGDLNYHKISLHSNEKNFQCEFCGKAFARKYSLVLHRRIHTQEKNYKCDFCPKTFRASSYLQNHRKIHTGEKPYECPTCNKKFRVGGDLRRHMKIHDRNKNEVSKNSETPKVSKKKNNEKKAQIKLPKDTKTKKSLKITIPVINENSETESDVNSINDNIKTEDSNLITSTQNVIAADNFSCNSNANIENIFKTDNQFNNILSTLPVNIVEASGNVKKDLFVSSYVTTTTTLVKNVSSSMPSTAVPLFTSSSVSSSPSFATITTYIISDVINSKNLKLNKIVKNQ